jgi:hypothetical protein
MACRQIELVWFRSFGHVRRHERQRGLVEEKSPDAMAKAGDAKRVKYYRNPMGLPDKSDTPKKDNMGMAYLPVYEGEDDQDDDSSVKVSAGKLQKRAFRPRSRSGVP